MREGYSRAATFCFLLLAVLPLLAWGSLNIGIDLSRAVATTQSNKQLVCGNPFCGEVCQREGVELSIQNVSVTACFSITWMDLVEQT